MITLENVSILKSGMVLFRNFSWTINKGEHWVISGDNGSGKTTLLEAIAGVARTGQGTITYSFVTGTSWDERHAQRKRGILYIPSLVGQVLPGNQQLFYQQRYYSIGDEQIPLVRELLDPDTGRLSSLTFPKSFSLDRLLDLPVTRLSNGQLKKVLILQHLQHHIPKVLLLDYPFEGLDPESRADLLGFLDHLATHYHVQLILTDHHPQLPASINNRLVLDQFKIKSIEKISPAREATSISFHGNRPYPTSTDPVVKLKDVTIRYGQQTLIENFNWTVHRGERWALTGRNGSGKTTLFSMIYADHPMAYSQEVYLFGKRRGTGESIWDIKKRISYLGPELLSYLHPQQLEISGYIFLLRTAGQPAPQYLENIIGFFEADKWINQPVHTLSSGQLQLLMVINSLLTERELLLLDEPFQFLDANHRHKLSEFLQQRLHADTTLILITHYDEDIRSWTKHHKKL